MNQDWKDQMKNEGGGVIETLGAKVAGKMPNISWFTENSRRYSRCSLEESDLKGLKHGLNLPRVK